MLLSREIDGDRQEISSWAFAVHDDPRPIPKDWSSRTPMNGSSRPDAYDRLCAPLKELAPWMRKQVTRFGASRDAYEDAYLDTTLIHLFSQCRLHEMTTGVCLLSGISVPTGWMKILSGPQRRAF
jgi:hypothetical protein